MNLKELKDKLKKEKDPEKFLRDLLKKTKDKELIEEIKDLLEKREHRGESRLERAVRNVRVERREPELTTKIPHVVFEDEPRVSTGVRPDLAVRRRDDVDYGVNVGGGDYSTGSVIQKLEGSSMVVKEGHLGTAETQSLVDQKMGEYNIRSKEASKYQEGRIYEGTVRESFAERTVFDEVLGVDRDKKKRRLGDYVQ